MDLSLDDIIKKKKINLKGNGGFKKFGGNNANQNRGNTQNNPIRRAGNIQQRRIGPQNTGRTGPPITGRINASNAGRIPPQNKPVVDARNRIIQKKRQQLTDARDKLCELAKRTDARQKLEKLRELRLGHDGVLGYNGLHPNIRKPVRSPLKGLGRTGMVPAALSLQRTINQPIGTSRYIPKVPALMDMDLELSDGFMSEGVMPLRRTVNNDQMRMEPLIRPSKLSSSSPYSWRAPVQRPVQPNTSRGYIDLDYPAEERKRMKLPSPPPVMRPIVVSDDEDMVEPMRPPPRPSRAPTSSAAGIAKARLESSRPQSSSASASGPLGYRIVVSNLQNTVTHEDIRELFEDIGPLVTSRLVRPGTAEVVYRQFKDAERAVDNYHNRQLDGQPMKCLLVKPRTSASTAAPSSGSLRATVGASSKLSGSGKSSVVPDITTIHKALFNKS